MALKPYQEKILQLLKTQESLLSTLYASYAKQFAEYKTFWEKLSKEEDQHARLIEKLRTAEEKGLVFFDEGKIKTYTLNTFIDNLEKIIGKSEKGELSPASAFAHAVDFETSLIEKNVFTHFDALTEKSKVILKLLNTETLKHIEKVKQIHKEATS